jgi:ribosome-associated toxin RatA of RatAB toxin-antitoxin module
MKWLLIIAAILLLPILVMLVAGLFLPVKHSVTRSIHLNQKPEVVFALLQDSTNLPSWSSTVASVAPLSEQDGKPAVQCTLKWGHMQMIMTQSECTPPSRLVITMTKSEGTVLGTWTYQIAPDAEGCRVALTEEGELKNPFFRVMARMRGLDANMMQTLRDLAKKFGEDADVRAGA